LIERVKLEIAKVIIGQQAAIDQALIVILARQHALIEGVPGIAKTLLVRTLAYVLGCPFGRIQFTPDLMPADITGTNVFNLQRNEFTLVRGPVFTTFLLADEINRAPAKTQSALLQAMQEPTVTGLRRLRHPKSNRVRRHLPTPRSAERPLHDENLHDLAFSRGGVRTR
jgi:MoxR-like ATPase